MDSHWIPQDLSMWDSRVSISKGMTRTFAGPHPLWLAHANTLWMWNTIMHKTEPMSVSYEPALKPLLDKSPPTGVQEFGSLMKKSCCAGRSRSAWFLSALSRPWHGGELLSMVGEMVGTTQNCLKIYSSPRGDSSEQVGVCDCLVCSDLLISNWDMLCACECTICVVWFIR